MRRAGVVLMVVALALGVGAALAGATRHKKPKGHVWGARITLQHPSARRFTGTVKSKFEACAEGRLVNVFFTNPSGGTALLSVQRTNGKGRYSIDLTQGAYPGVYQAQAAHERIRARKAPQTCKEGNSAIFGI